MMLYVINFRSSNFGVCMSSVAFRLTSDENDLLQQDPNKCTRGSGLRIIYPDLRSKISSFETIDCLTFSKHFFYRNMCKTELLVSEINPSARQKELDNYRT